MSFDYNKERLEAVQAGTRARNSLQKALDALDSAKGWGIFDMLGGGFVPGFVKHSKMDKASEYIVEAKEHLMCFNRELRDIEEHININVSTGDFWGIADVLFDDLISDCVMQDRINNAREQLQAAIYKVDDILYKIRKDD